MKPVFEKPKIFISHGYAGDSLNIFRSFLESLNFEVIVVIKEPSSGMTLSEKVKSYIHLSDCILVIATPDNKEETTSTFQPRANVSHEIGYAEALKKPIIYLKHDRVDFGSNYSDKVWIAFSEKNYHDAFQQLIEETKKIGLLSIVGKINKESIKSEIVEKLLRLVDILNIKDSTIKSNILYELALALYKKSEEQTDAEKKDFFDFYPEYSQTCAYDGYKNENLDSALRLMSVSIQMNPLSSRKVDYVSMLSDALYIGEGILNEDIKKELNSLLMEEARNGNLFQDKKHIELVGFYLEILSEENRQLFWGHAANTHEVAPELVNFLKHLIVCIFGDQSTELPQYKRPSGYPICFTTNQSYRLSSSFQLKTILEEKLKNACDNEKRLIFRFLAKHVTNEDLNECISIIKNGTEDEAARAIWVIGEAGLTIKEKVISTFEMIFN